MEKRRRNDRSERRDNPRSAERRGERKGYGNPQPMDLYRIEVGRMDGVEVRHIVGAIANEGILIVVTSVTLNFTMTTPPWNCHRVCQKNCSNNSANPRAK
ncbi:cold-shock DEAD box protein A [Rodentibacter pneumotropicus]|uniref:Cold-shock DEAD box protein A n=1 Tax=Rodentibacter pneumotropicus TaxID=758 RepID=A0A448MTL4_9PAST|nr:cold-shock DEAD box protein A [Rodentibacter pneumotropicus]